MHRLHDLVVAISAAPAFS